MQVKSNNLPSLRLLVFDTHLRSSSLLSTRRYAIAMTLGLTQKTSLTLIPRSSLYPLWLVFRYLCVSSGHIKLYYFIE